MDEYLDELSRFWNQEIGLCHAPEFFEYEFSTKYSILDEFSRNRSSLCPGNLPLRVNFVWNHDNLWAFQGGVRNSHMAFFIKRRVVWMNFTTWDSLFWYRYWIWSPVNQTILTPSTSACKFSLIYSGELKPKLNSGYQISMKLVKIVAKSFQLNAFWIVTMIASVWVSAPEIMLNAWMVKYINFFIVYF